MTTQELKIAFHNALLNYQYFIILECFVATGNHALAWLQTFENLVILRILATYTDVATIGLRATLVEYKYPLASCGLEEGATRNDDGLLGLTQFEVDLIGLTRTDVLRTRTFEDEIAAELTIAHFRINLAHLQLVFLVTTVKGCC